MHAPAGRIATLDAVRGFAVLGILLMNIVAMGLPGYAYVNPTFAGLGGPADWAAWGINYVLTDGKMRALFTMLFGASMVLIAERAAADPGGMGPAETHYRRMFWLFLFGMLHAWLLWYGDILTAYAVAGAFTFSLWTWRPRALAVFALVMLAIQLSLNVAHHLELAANSGASTAAAFNAAREIALYRGGVAEVFEARVPTTIFFQTVLLVATIPELFGFIAFGILLYRTGFLTGALSRRAYLQAMALGYLVAAPLAIPLARLLVARGFDSVVMPLVESAGLVLRPFIACAHAAAVILLLRSGVARWLMARLEAAGRMAFSNYIGTSIVTTTIFYGYGFRLFGHLSRAELYWVVLGVWALILLWSKPWLECFRYGPLEWLWRSLARGERQPMFR